MTDINVHEGISKEIGTTINNLQNNGIDFLYDLELQQNNLFFVAAFQDMVIGDSNKDEAKNTNYLSPYFRINAINFNLPKLEFDWNETMRINVLKGVTLQDISKITVTWYDDVYKSVLLYHCNWLNNWYNMKGDYLPVGITGKYKSLVMYTYHFKEEELSNVDKLLERALPSPEWLFKIECNGIAPESFGETSLKFDMKQSNATTGVSANYRINGLKITVNKDIDYYSPTDNYLNDNAFTDKRKENVTTSNELFLL